MTLNEAVSKARSLNTACFPVKGSYQKLMLSVSLAVIAGLFDVDVEYVETMV